MSALPPPGSSEFDALLHTIRFPGDSDPAETREWLDALATLVREGGAERARFVLAALQDEARRHPWPGSRSVIRRTSTPSRWTPKLPSPAT